MAVSCIRNASGHSYRNSSFIVELAIGQIPRSTERISSFVHILHLGYMVCNYCEYIRIIYWFFAAVIK